MAFRILTTKDIVYVDNHDNPFISLPSDWAKDKYLAIYVMGLRTEVEYIEFNNAYINVNRDYWFKPVTIDYAVEDSNSIGDTKL